MDVSMVITTLHRAHLLKHSLARLAELTLPDELLVIDDGGGDPETKDVCHDFRNDLPIEYIYNHNPGHTICSLARNIGVRRAKNEWIVTAEPELIFISDVLAQYAELEPEHRGDVISSGLVYFAPPHYVPGEDVRGLETAGDYTPPLGADPAIGWVAPYTGLWHKDWLTEVNGWDEMFPGPWGWDDIDLLTRLRIQGHGQHIDEGIVGVHLFHGLGGDANFVNEAHFKAKSFQGGEYDLTDVVANREHQWGELRQK